MLSRPREQGGHTELPATAPAAPAIANRAATTAVAPATAVIPDFRDSVPLGSLTLALNGSRTREERSSLGRQAEQSARCDRDRKRIFFHRIDPKLHAPFLGNREYSKTFHKIQSPGCVLTVRLPPWRDISQMHFQRA